ncbi:MAG: hypothetical protein RIT19_2052 [Verrucomicrobiota bacterium]
MTLETRPHATLRGPCRQHLGAAIHFWRGLFVVGLAVGMALGLQAETLIPTGALWRWRAGTNEASAPITAWRSPDFTDAQFVSARAPFWFGDALTGGTQISGMQNVYGSIFLRRAFVVSQPSELAGLRMGALVDDGFVAWINGTEVLRVNVPGASGDPVSTGTLADNAVEPVAFTQYALPNPAGYLRPGTNLLAVQVFQSSLGSSDLGFEASMESVLKDPVPPTVLKLDPSPGATVETFTALTVTFSEPVTGVVAAHLQVNGIGARSVTAVDASTYRFEFAPPAYGAVTVGWDSRQTITDQAEPPNAWVPVLPGTGTGSVSYTLIDRTAPAVSALQPADGSAVRTLETVTVLFSEPVTGVDAADLLIHGIPATTVSGIGGTEFRFGFAPPPAGPVSFSWAPGHGITDLAVPSNAFGGMPWTVRLDPNASEAAPYLSEFMASNTRTLKDETGQFVDWIEVFNPSDAPLDLRGWSLTDDAGDLTKWRFPATNLAAGGFLVVFASGADRRTPGSRLHTNFQLSAGGEYLALVRPDGTNIASEFKPAYARQVPDVSHGVVQQPQGNSWLQGPSGVYFTQPTPGGPNLGGTAVPGPVIEDIQHTPRTPTDTEDLRVTARVRGTFQGVASVTLRWRVHFGPEASLPMWDDGAHGDGPAGDGVWAATLPAEVAAPGQMIRYRIFATDTQGTTSRWPLFPNPTTSPEYLGTMVLPTNLVTRLPVFHLFVAPNQLAGIDTESGGRVSLFHDGELYDNAYMELRGNTSAGLNKKSHRLEFNRGHELRHPGPGGSVRKSALLAEYLDPAYVRQHLCFWFLDSIGVPSPFHYPVRVHLNGQFYQLAFHNDVIGQEQVERMGYDPRGALYKAVGNLTPNFASTGVFQKLEPDNDPSRTDYLQLANGINENAPLTTRRNTVFDLLDVPQVINHLAGTRWCAENDDVWANMSVYRDTFGDGLWRNIPFDMNASWGQLYGGSNPLEATVDGSKSHPLYGGSSTGGNFNRLYDVIVRLPETRQMLLRRQRSILDLMVQPPGTPFEQRILENRVITLTNLIGPEALLDRAKWGASPWAANKTFAAGVGDLLNQFIEPRRRHWYVTHSITNTARAIGINNANNAGIPLSQPEDAAPEILDVDFNPLSGNQSQEWVALTNRSGLALDLTGWKLTGAVDFTFRPGTVMPSNSVVYVSPDVRQFRARTTGPRGGQGLFVVGPYSGQLSARGETVALVTPRGKTAHQLAYVGDPSPAQRWLRITEIFFNPPAGPAGSPPSDDLEFLELRNLSTTETLDLAGVRLVEGVEFDFGASLLKRLPPGERVVIVAQPGAFAARYGSAVPVAGQYSGRLDNGGERLRLIDARGEEILDFEYKDGFPAADGGGFSLEVVDEQAAPDAWNDKSQWRAGTRPGGTPGTGGSAPGPRLVAQPTATGLVLRFTASAQQRCLLQVSEALELGAWSTVLEVSAQPVDRPIEHTEPLQGGRRFYRVLVTAAP